VGGAKVNLHGLVGLLPSYNLSILVAVILLTIGNQIANVFSNVVAAPGP